MDGRLLHALSIWITKIVGISVPVYLHQLLVMYIHCDANCVCHIFLFSEPFAYSHLLVTLVARAAGLQIHVFDEFPRPFGSKEVVS